MNPLTKSVVLVDDEKSYTELMTLLLTDNLDCPVHGFTHPLEALRALPAIDPAVIVTDYHMPQLNGIEFIRQASAIAPRAAVIMITGHNLAAEEDQLARLPALRGFLAKPFGWRTLADEILRVWPTAAEPDPQRADATSL